MADGSQSTELVRLEPDTRGTASLAVALAKADVDQQVATAHAYPREPKRVANAILSLATLDEETATECVYALTRSGKAIRGPSVRLAEIIASQWGNCRAGARVVHVDRVEKFIEAEGIFHDLETNSATTARIRRSIRTKTGAIFSDDMIVVVGNAACAIAKRNAILGGVPKAAWRKAYDAVEKVIAGDIRTLTERRDAAIKAFAAFGVNGEQLCKSLGVGGVEAITLDHLTTLVGMHSAIKSGEETVESMFAKDAAPPPAPPAAPKALPPAPAAAEPEPLADQDGHLAHLEEQLAVCSNKAEFDEVWESQLETSDGRLDRDHQERAEGVYRTHAKRIAAKAKVQAEGQKTLV